MIAAANPMSRRLGLDALVRRMTNPGFVMQYRRAPTLRERSGHVSPTMLAVQTPRSRYVRTWRRHARRCPECAAAFRFFGLSLK
jgi:hypothetical protein